MVAVEVAHEYGAQVVVHESSGDVVYFGKEGVWCVGKSVYVAKEYGADLGVDCNENGFGSGALFGFDCEFGVVACIDGNTPVPDFRARGAVASGDTFVVGDGVFG